VSDPALDDALARIWARAQPKLLARVDAIDRGIDALAGGGDPAAIATGSAEAHKIVGLVGTFDLDEASRLARALEHGLEAPADADVSALRRQSAQLREMLAREAPGG
jgi:hypothetical protein